MSASLVGSEMCIRDSSAQAHPSGASGINFEVVSGAAQLKLRAHGAISVSYTHLTLPTICSV
eukprot:9075247-Alexandrium_andersonii.AAC.1